VSTVHDVRAVALTLPRTTEHLVHDRVKFRIKSIVYAALSRDEEWLGFAFPKDERDSLVAADDRFVLPGTSDLRYHWVVGRLDRIDPPELREIVVDAWRMCVPKFVAAAYDAAYAARPR
jgi:hypothetical protein